MNLETVGRYSLRNHLVIRSLFLDFIALLIFLLLVQFCFPADSLHMLFTQAFFPRTFALHFYEDYEGLVEIALANAFQLVLAEIIVYITCAFKCSHVRNQLFLSPGSQLMVERSFVMERSAQVAALSL